MTDTTITITPEGKAVLDNMKNRCLDVANTFGMNSPEYIRMKANHSDVQSAIFRLGGTVTPWFESSPEVNALSLYVASYIHYGVNFTPDNDESGLLGTWSVNS